MKNNKFRKRSRAEIRAWLKTQEGQAWLQRNIREKDELKSARRMTQAVVEMKRLELHRDCANCLHGIGGHCSWVLPDGCLDYLEVGTLKELRR